MGYANEEDIARAGNYLLSILLVKGEIPYSLFYDGSEETADKLLIGMGYLKDNNRDDVVDCPEIFIDLAVGQLEGFGLIETQDTEELLADGEQGYSISLTSKGRDFLNSKSEFRFRGMML